MSSDLSTIYDKRKSFYGKAKVDSIGKSLVLWSYDTIVCEIKGSEAIVKFIILFMFSV